MEFILVVLTIIFLWGLIYSFKTMVHFERSALNTENRENSVNEETNEEKEMKQVIKEEQERFEKIKKQKQEEKKRREEEKRKKEEEKSKKEQQEEEEKRKKEIEKWEKWMENKEGRELYDINEILNADNETAELEEDKEVDNKVPRTFNVREFEPLKYRREFEKVDEVERKEKEGILSSMGLLKKANKEEEEKRESAEMDRRVGRLVKDMKFEEESDKSNLNKEIK